MAMAFRQVPVCHRSPDSRPSAKCLFGFMESLDITLCRLGKHCRFTDNLLQCVLDVCIGRYWFEVAASLVQLLTNVPKDSEVAVDVNPKQTCSPLAGGESDSVHFDYA